MRSVFRVLTLTVFVFAVASVVRAASGNGGASSGFIPVSQESVTHVLRIVFSRWNTVDMDSTLAQSFPARQRLLDSMPTLVPADAKLELISVQGVQVLKQRRSADSVTSWVSVTVRAQAEFEDPRSGLQHPQGTAIYILRITRTATP